jgi:hypothetical protein
MDTPLLEAETGPGIRDKDGGKKRRMNEDARANKLQGGHLMPGS